MDKKGVHYYKVRIKETYEAGQDLVITVRGDNSKSDPDLYISSKNEAPSGRGDSEYSCAMVGEDICTIPSSAVSPGKIFYVTTRCYRACNYHISANLMKEVEIYGRKDYKIYAKAGEERIFKYTNPHGGVKALMFSARADRKDAAIRMYIKEGVDSTPTTSDMRSSDSWEDATVIKITNTTMVKVGEGLTYKILFETDDDVNAKLRVDLTYNDKIISEGQVYEDFVYFNDQSCYKYNVKSTDKKLRIGAYSFSGNPDIYVNPDRNPGDLNDFAFKATEPSDDVIVITPEDRLKLGYKKGFYVICIKGHSSTSYRLRVVESNENYFLEDGIAETNELNSGSEATFYYTDGALVRDLNVTFTLSLKSGPIPNMYVKFCGRVPEDQCIISNKDDPSLISSTSEHGQLYSFAKHSGNLCKKTPANQHLPCLYAIEVSTPLTLIESVTHFSLVAQHSETTHLKLREGISVDQIVENHQFRYFQFVNRDESATNVTFSLSSHHGDADMYISRTEKYPDLKAYEKKSTRSSRFADEITFNKNKDKSLIGVYYIAVQGFEYASYSLRVNIVRGDENQNLTIPIQLSEGITHNEFMHGPKDKKFYRFRTSLYGENASDIRVSVTKVIGNYKFYVKSGSLPTITEYDYMSDDGSEIIMRPTDEKYKSVGNKYVLVVPNNKFGDIPNGSRFMIKYSTGTTIHQIKIDHPAYGTVKVGQYNYFVYHSIEKVSELTVSLTPLSGDANLVVSTDPQNQSPTTSVNTFHSKKEGKDSIVIDGSKLFQDNPSCNPTQQILAGGKPCQIYIGVYCADQNDLADSRSNDSCSFSVKVYSDFGLQHLINDGIPQKDHVKQAEMITYYMPIEIEKDYLYIAANTDVGDVKVYVSFASQSDKTEDLLNPTKDEHTKKSKGVSHSQLIHFTKKEIIKNCEDFDECMALISVEGNGSVQYNEFTISAYTHLPKLIPNSPAVGIVEEDSFVYYTYKSYCEDCTLVISASPYSIDADIDMYINFGGKKDLPTTNSYDIKLEEWFSEHIELDLQHPYLEKQKVKSMQETIIIGIYAKEATTVSVEIEETTSRIKRLNHGKGVLIEQDRNDIKYFKYQHKGDHDIKFELTGLHGEVEMRANCYKPHENDSPEHKFLPSDDKTSIWKTNSMQDCTIIIDNEDTFYCENGVYLLSVTSKENGAKYTLEAQRGDAFTTKEIKIGVPIKDQIEDDHMKQYMFVLDKQKPFRVSVSVYTGKVKYSIGNSKDYRKPILSSEDGDLIIDERDVDNFEMGENVYLRLEGEYEHSEFILVVTHDDSYSIIPDSYTQEYTISPYDTDGIKLMFYPPALEHQLKIQIDGNTDGVTFDVMSKKEYIYQIKSDRLQFPHNHEHDIGQNLGQWDVKSRHIIQTVNMKAKRDDDYVILLTIRPNSVIEESTDGVENVKIYVNVNSHPVNLLTPNIATEDQVSTQLNDYSYFKFFANGSKNYDLVLIPCVCMSEMYVFGKYEDALGHKDSIHRTTQLINGEKRISLRNVSGPFFVKVMLSPDNEHIEFRDASSYCAFQVILVDKDHENYKYSIDNFSAENNGLVDYDYPDLDHANLRLSWGKILKQNSLSTSEHNSVATMYALKERDVFANSVCGIRHAYKRNKILATWNNLYTNEHIIHLVSFPQITASDYITFYINAGINKNGAVIPYQPLTIPVEGTFFRQFPWWIVGIVIVVIAALGYGTYYFRNRAVDTQAKLDFEMNDIRNVARVPYQDDTVERDNLQFDA